MWCTGKVTIAINNKMHLICSLSVSLCVIINTVVFSSLQNMWMCPYYIIKYVKCIIETRVKLYTHSLYYSYLAALSFEH